MPAIHWFRRDLRLADNTALHHASKAFDQVVPVYILSHWQQQHAWTGANRQQFLCGNLKSLSKNLEAIGSRFIIRCGDAETELEKLFHQTHATALYANRDPDPFGKAMESKIAKLCHKLRIAFHLYHDSVLHGPEEVLNSEGNPYRIYTPYSKNWISLPKPEMLPRVRSLGPATLLRSAPLPAVQHWQLASSTADLPEPGERAARQRMKNFIEGPRLRAYAEQRNFPSGNHTSALSPDLRFGLISIRELYHRCRQMKQGTNAAACHSIDTYIKELAWREFYMAVLHYWPEVLVTEFNPEFRSVSWDSLEQHLEAWKQGRTGFPIVDAGMRQLTATGWMHNRVRMIVSMFLTKDLHCHWRLGESHFMQQLIDGEIASNNGGWQWSAGTGADAAPYFRIQNPWLQSKRYDPAGSYIKQWIPELQNVAASKLHEVPVTPLAKNYPLPIVNHQLERNKALARFKQAMTSSRDKGVASLPVLNREP